MFMNINILPFITCIHTVLPMAHNCIYHTFLNFQVFQNGAHLI